MTPPLASVTLTHNDLIQLVIVRAQNQCPSLEFHLPVRATLTYGEHGVRVDFLAPETRQ